MNAAQIQERAAQSPYTAHLQLEVRSLDPGSLTLRMPMRAALRRSETAEQFHGGAIATLIDVASVYAVAALKEAPAPTVPPTVHLSVEYLKPGTGPWVDASARVRREGRSLATVDVEVLNSDGELVALGRAICMNA